jgi:hypothetical protein
MVHERPDHTLQATALVPEAYLRLIDVENVGWQDRAHFFCRGCTDDASNPDGSRTGATDCQTWFRGEVGSGRSPGTAFWRPSELVALDDALNTMAAMDPRKAKVIELRFFAGLSVEEAAEVLKISPQICDAGLEAGAGVAEARVGPVWLTVAGPVDHQ